MKIIVPTLMRHLTANQKTVEAQGQTVRQVIDALEQQYPGLAARLIDGGEVHKFINIYVNDDDIRFLQSLDSAVTQQDQITILPAVAGGCF
ncbi:MoaD/ThiS family protein [Pseudomonas sp. TH05]|uniref:MoaD/ThiS family protein n=1 Tax=unclassified Pseudomonas TaxID=196821 RepID=UPI00099635A3|nr:MULTISPECIES: MoaD/ThiS family protein [unclassified Pseudomonas]MBK5541961.1 MoaD/ThiS family protein [Pseudomonas sp. TH07]MBK5557679.1 MoaD/ThiS family protein [Pseudomonas sp. TH05]OOW00700.1 molybdopterin synthase sulfur carrier subunit [Pseudomonas sp. MF4836]